MGELTLSIIGAFQFKIAFEWNVCIESNWVFGLVGGSFVVTAVTEGSEAGKPGSNIGQDFGDSLHANALGERHEQIFSVSHNREELFISSWYGNRSKLFTFPYTILLFGKNMIKLIWFQVFQYKINYLKTIIWIQVINNINP